MGESKTGIGGIDLMSKWAVPVGASGRGREQIAQETLLTPEIIGGGNFYVYKTARRILMRWVDDNAVRCAQVDECGCVIEEYKQDKYGNNEEAVGRFKRTKEDQIRRNELRRESTNKDYDSRRDEIMRKSLSSRRRIEELGRLEKRRQEVLRREVLDFDWEFQLEGYGSYKLARPEVKEE